MMEVDLPPASDEAQPGPSLPRSQEYSAPVSFPADGGAEPTLDQRVPCKLPPEVVAICDAYAASTPVIAIVARSFLSERRHIAVPEECGYAYLGFFKVTSVQERRLVSSNMPKMLEPGHVAGRMEWTFRCTWVPSGEDMPLYPDSDSDTESDHPPSASAPTSGVVPTTPSHPNPPPTPPPPAASTSAAPGPDVTPAPLPTRDDHIDDSENAKTNPRYLARCHKHPNHAVLLTSELHERFYSPLPDYMRAPPGDGLTVGDILTGWWCAVCGRVSFQRTLRHRVCVSLMCEARRWRKAKLKGKAKAMEDEEKQEGEGGGEEEKDREEGYAVGLWHLRDPAQAAPLSHPGNTYPAGAVDGMVGEWGDGMQTFTYTWVVPVLVQVQARNAAEGRGRRKTRGGSGGGGVIAVGASGQVEIEGQVTHVFTGNDRMLQVEAELLLRDLQIQVPLQRKMGGNSPYFSYNVGGPEKGAVPWDEVLECILHAKDAMLGRSGLYGEREVGMNVMAVLAWVVTGSRRVSWTGYHSRVPPFQN